MQRRGHAVVFLFLLWLLLLLPGRLQGSDVGAPSTSAPTQPTPAPNVYTSSDDGGECYFDDFRFDCAQCSDGCQCPPYNTDSCTSCGEGGDECNVGRVEKFCSASPNQDVIFAIDSAKGIIAWSYAKMIDFIKLLIEQLFADSSNNRVWIYRMGTSAEELAAEITSTSYSFNETFAESDGASIANVAEKGIAISTDCNLGFFPGNCRNDTSRKLVVVYVTAHTPYENDTSCSTFDDCTSGGVCDICESDCDLATRSAGNLCDFDGCSMHCAQHCQCAEDRMRLLGEQGAEQVTVFINPISGSILTDKEARSAYLFYQATTNLIAAYDFANLGNHVNNTMNEICKHNPYPTPQPTSAPPTTKSPTSSPTQSPTEVPAFNCSYGHVYVTSGSNVGILALNNMVDADVESGFSTGAADPRVQFFGSASECSALAAAINLNISGFGFTTIFRCWLEGGERNLLMAGSNNTDCRAQTAALNDILTTGSLPPTASPTKSPTASPTKSPTASPTNAPTASPTKSPTASPTDAPTASPTKAPTAAPYKVLDFPGGSFDPLVSEGNPLKGMLTNPEWISGYNEKESSFAVPTSLEFRFVALSAIMKGASNFSGFDSYLEPLLDAAAARKNQVVLRFYMDYPDQASGVPQFIIDSGVHMTNYDNETGAGTSPNYTDPILLNALEAFISELGLKYDGDVRIGFIQVGLIGFWGEWHVYPFDWDLSVAKNRVVDAFETHFDETQLNIRTPWPTADINSFGFHDDSFAYATLDGEDNGNISSA